MLSDPVLSIRYISGFIDLTLLFPCVLWCEESVQAIWALCFDKEVQARVAEDTKLGVVDFLDDTRHSENARVKASCNGALWTLKDALKTSSHKKYKEIGE